MNAHPQEVPVGTLLSELREEAQHLLRAHVRLASLELVSAGRDTVRRMILMAIWGAFAAVGYVFLLIGLGAALRPVFGWAGSYLVIGLTHVALGGAGMYFASGKAREKGLLEHTKEELKRSATFVSETAHGNQIVS